MFSLIITIISIALVAALALATLYYGGDAFKRGAASADATKLYVQTQQLQGAAELYKADTGAYPLTMEAMLTGNYLKSIPVSSLDPAQETGNSSVLMAQASAAGVVWKMVLAGYPVFAMTQVSAAVCEAVNLKAYGTAGILKSARAGYATQCFGPDLDNLTMVTTKSGAALITASLSPLATVDLGTVLTSAAPAVNSGDTTAAGWLTVEGVTVATVAPPAPSTAQSGIDTFYVGAAVYGQSDIGYAALSSSSQSWPETGETSLSSGIWLTGGLGDSDISEVIVENRSTKTGPLQVGFRPAVIGAPAPIAFGFTQTNDCNRSIAPGGTCTIQITYAPTQVDPAYSAEKRQTFLSTVTGYAGGALSSPSAPYYSAELLVWAGAAGSAANTTGSHQLAVSLHHYPSPALGSLKVQIEGTQDYYPVYSLVAVNGGNLAELTNTGYGNGFAFVQVGPGVIPGSGDNSVYAWSEFSINPQLTGTTGSFSVSPTTGDPAPSSASLSGWSTVLVLKEPYIYDTGSAVVLPPTGGAPRIWCATYPLKAPGDMTQKIGTAVVGACQ